MAMVVAAVVVQLGYARILGSAGRASRFQQQPLLRGGQQAAGPVDRVDAH
jgi:hypothetical protein